MQSFPHAENTYMATAYGMTYAQGHAYLTEQVGLAAQHDARHDQEAGRTGGAVRGPVRDRGLPLRATRGHPYRQAPAHGHTTNHGGAWTHQNAQSNARTVVLMREREALRGVVDKQFAKERRWVERRYGLPKSDVGTGVVAANGEGAGDDGARANTLDKAKAKEDVKGKGKAKEVDPVDEPIEDGMGVECQCCFSEYSFVSDLAISTKLNN